MQALVECEGDSIDLSGDMGAVGRIIISDTPGSQEMYLDLKGGLSVQVSWINDDPVVLLLMLFEFIIISCFLL